MAPELIAVEALQEWSQARNTMRNCAMYTNDEMQMVQAFYIGMLALRYKSGNGNKVMWPNQFEWLLREGLIAWRDHASWGLSIDNINDKNKTDGVVKLAALIQVLWFLAQCLMRKAHNLPLSQYESMTISYVPLFAITYYLWWVKPKDVMAATLVDLPTMSDERLRHFERLAVSNIFDASDHPENRFGIVWALTPRVFEKEARDQVLQEARRQAGLIVRSTRICETTKYGRAEVEHSVPQTLDITLPEEIVLSHWDPELYHSKVFFPLSCICGASFGALHLISWNSHFPTVVEQWLWRASSIASIVTVLVFMHYEKVVLKWGGPLTLISIISPLIYIMSRVLMMGGVVAAFRAMEPRVYETYIVSDYWISMFS